LEYLPPFIEPLFVISQTLAIKLIRIVC